MSNIRRHYQRREDWPMGVPKEVLELIDRFDRNRDSYRSGLYNETQARREFIDPLFLALGWDVDNKQGYAEAYKDVVHEDAIKIGDATKAPDYCFRVGGTRKFFVEAKKPSVNLKDDISPAFQLRRYAWSAKLPLSILTDFEELAIYDCRNKPDKMDKSSTGRIMYFTYEQYPDNWEKIASIFSRDAVLRGSFDRFADSFQGKRGTAEVDDAFLKEIEGWREQLAHNLALRNADLDARELNFAVQQTIDRIIFLRICEDRGIEAYGRLQALLEGKQVYERLIQLFRQADQKYNSGLFHFENEKDNQTSPDTLTLGLTVDDKPLKEIVRSLYYPDSPYEFSVLPADILGQVYEQFLGKVIRLTPGHHALVEEKPEVKKAGGVFYTPTYIVDSIVKETVGRLLLGRTLKQAASIKILDPACGSGSFLIGAYQFLLDWHRDRYIEAGQEKHRKELYQTSGGDWRLATGERKRILLNNIYGVDIDPQAVETTKLSLLLKVLEGESEQSLTTQLRLFQERALPDLGKNIKCGNSLIEPDYFGEPYVSGLTEQDHKRINSFGWATEFRDVFDGGGFDAVIGNPPYIRIQNLQEWAPFEVDYYKKKYDSASKGNYDIYVVVVERGLGLLRKDGVLGFILPHKFFNANYGEALRGLISKGKHLKRVVHFGDQQVFESATTYTCLMFLSKSSNDSCEVELVTDLDAWKYTGQAEKGLAPAVKIGTDSWNFVVGKGSDLFDRLSEAPTKLADVTSRIFQGIKTSADSIYILEELGREQDFVRVFSKSTGKEHLLEAGLLHPLIKGGDSKPFHMATTKRLLLFPYGAENGKVALLSSSIIKARFPQTWSYLLENKKALEEREDGKMKVEGWYGYVYPKALEVMPLPKLFTPDIASRCSFSFDVTGESFFTGGVSGGYGIIPLPQFSPHFLLGILNSRLLEWYNRKVATQMRGGYFSFESRYIKNWPILIGEQDAEAIQRIAKLASDLVALHKQIEAQRLPVEREQSARRAKALEETLNKTVYELYKLSEAEVKMVENETEQCS